MVGSSKTLFDFARRLMSQEAVLRFLLTARDDPAVVAAYDNRNLIQLLFQAKNDGFDFTAEEIGDAVGKLEANVILNKDKDPFDETSRLWREMWGMRHFEYLVARVVSRHTDEELRALLTDGQSSNE